MTTAYITHQDCFQHDMGQGHPEQPARLTAIQDALHEAQLMDYLTQYEAPLATDDQILLVHSQQHLDFMKQTSPTHGVVALDSDTSMNPHTLRAACRAVGATTFGVDLLMKKEVETAFCATRPPGHHAEREKAITNLIAAGVLPVLIRVDQERALEVGNNMGITMYQGFLIDDLLNKPKA